MQQLTIGYLEKMKYNTKHGFYLSKGIMRDLDEPNYFREGYRELFPTHPTYFRTKKSAIKAARLMGFTVIE